MSVSALLLSHQTINLHAPLHGSTSTRYPPLQLQPSFYSGCRGRCASDGQGRCNLRWAGRAGDSGKSKQCANYPAFMFCKPAATKRDAARRERHVAVAADWQRLCWEPRSAAPSRRVQPRFTASFTVLTSRHTPRSLHTRALCPQNRPRGRHAAVYSRAPRSVCCYAHCAAARVFLTHPEARMAQTTFSRGIILHERGQNVVAPWPVDFFFFPADRICTKYIFLCFPPIPCDGLRG